MPSTADSHTSAFTPDVASPNGSPPVGAAAGPAVVEQAIPDVVSAAWELELIIAGAVTFALFQLPGSLDVVRDRLLARVDGSSIFPVMLVFTYARVIVYVLIGSFLLNLVARAYWVGLVGLHSVFPRGVRWSEIGAGPIFTEVYRARVPSLQTVIARVDNFASIIFSFAFLIVVGFLFSLTAIGATGAVVYAVAATLFRSVDFGQVAFAVALAYIVPMLALGLFDRKYGDRLPVDSPARRRLRAGARWATRLNGSALMGAIMFTLFSNVGRKRTALLMQAVLMTSFAVALAGFMADIGALRTGAQQYVPDDPRVRGVSADNYESLRAPAAWAPVPTIQSDVVDGPYVRLFVPYEADRVNPAIARGCPGVRPLRSDRFHIVKRSGAADSATLSGADRALACLDGIYAIAMDGARVPDVRLRYYVHPATGHDGVLAYLPTAPLASGAHELTIQRPNVPGDTRPPRPVTIAFWK